MCDLCDRGISDDPVRMQQYGQEWRERVRDRIRHRPWMITHVAGGHVEPSFACITGLTGLGHPELVVVYPDARGTYPWEPGLSPAALQPADARPVRGLTRRWLTSQPGRPVPVSFVV